MAITKSSGITSRVGLGAMVVLLSGCASFSQDGGFTQVEQASHVQLDKQVTWVKTPEQRSQVVERVAELLAEPLTVDAAVQVALLNNRDLQASFDALGIS